jgi:hypothetical protein
METITKTQELTTLDKFAPFEAQAKEWMAKAELIKVTDVNQVDLIKGAKEARLALRRIRIDIENIRVELKDEYLRKGNEIQTIANRLKALIEPIEAHLKEQEDFEQIQAAKIKKEILEERLTKLKPVMGKDAELMPLAEMSETAFDNMLNGAILAKEKNDRDVKEALEREEENKKRRLADDLAVREENARLKKERDERQAELHKQQQIAQQKIQKERAERKEAEDKLNAKLQQEENEKKEAAAAARKAKRAPDKIKLLTLAEQIELLPLPDLKDEESKQILMATQGLLAKVVKYLKDKSETL